MAALSKRDIEMIFRAETSSATRNIGDLRKESKSLRATLDDLSQAAAKGDVNLESLEKTTRDLKQVMDELGTARSLLTTLNNQNAALDKADAKVAAAAKRYAELKAQVEGAERPTKRLINSYAAAERALNAATEGQERQAAQFAETKAQIEAIIGPVNNYKQAFQDIATTSKEVGRSLAVTGEQADAFKAKLADLAKQQQAAAADKAFVQQGLDAGLLQSQIEYISQFENRVELLNIAKRELASQNAGFEQALRAQEAREGAQNVARLQQAFKDAAEEEQRLEQINAFRKIATDARASIADVSRFEPAMAGSAVAAERLADAILQIVEPARAAVQSVDGIEATIMSASNVLGGRGRRSLEEYNDALNEIALSNAALVRVAKDVDAFTIQAEAAARAEANFESLRQEALKLADAFDPSAADAERLANELRQAEAAMEAAGREMQTERTKADALGASLRKAGIDTDNMADAQRRLAATARLGAQQQEAIQRKVGRKGTGPFGFSLQDTQNLGYQINDLITQISSGTPVTQAFAQQFGQIYQIPAIQNLIAQFARLIPLIALAGAGIAVFVGGMNRLQDRAQNLKQLRATLTEIGQDTGQAERLQAIADSLDALGISSQDAAASVKTLTREGLDPKLVEDFVVAAKNVTTYTDALGESVPEATQTMIDGFDGTRDSILDLDDKFHFLSDSTREQIAAQDDGKISTDLLSEAFDQFYVKAQDVATQVGGDSVDASRALENAWDDLLEAVGTSGPWDAIVKYMKNVRLGAALTIRVIAGLVREWGGAVAQVAKGVFQFATGNYLGAYSTLTAASSKRGKSFGEIVGDARKATLADMANDPTTRERTGGGYRAPRQRAQPAKAERKGRKPGKSDAQKDAERVAKQIESLEEQLTNSLDQMNAQVAKAAFGSLETQLENAAKEVDSRFAKLYRDVDELDRLSKGKALINGQSIAQFREQLNVNKQILLNAAKLKVFEENLNDLTKQRNDLLADIEARQQSGELSGVDAAREAAEVTSKLNPQIQSLVAAGKAFAESIGDAELSPELQAFLSKLDRAGAEAGRAGPGSVIGKQAASNLGQQENELNQIIAERNALIAANNELVELGLKTQVDARTEAAAAFQQAEVQIKAQTQGIRDTIAVLLAQGAITQQVYDTWIAKLAAVDAQATYVDERILQMNNAVQGAFVQGFTNMFDTLAQGLANLVTGTGDVGDVLADLGRAALQFAADFLKAMADVLVQLLAIQAVKAIFGASSGGIGGLFFHSGGTVGSYAGGTRRRSGLSISPLAVAAAPRYHSGTQGAGLRPDETLAVLQRGEKVLTEEQQLQERRRLAAQGGTKTGGLRQVLAFGDDEVAGAMAGPAGEQVVVTHIRRNRGRIRQELGLNG